MKIITEQKTVNRIARCFREREGGCMKKFFRIMMVAVAALLAFSAAACGDSGGKSGGKGDGEITVWWPGATAQKAAIEKAKADYEAAHEGVTIKISTQSVDNFYSSYAMVVGKNNEPDLVLLDSVYIQVLAHYFGNPALANISSYYGSKLDDYKGKFYSSLWDTGYFKGNLYAVPYAANAFGLAYNTVLMERVLKQRAIEYDDINDCVPSKLGAKTEKFSLLWWCDQVSQYNSAAGKSLSALTVASGAEYASVASMQYVSMLARLGGRVMNDDLSVITMANDDYADDKAANEELKSILNTLGNTGVVTTNFEEARFEQGNTLFIETGCWKISKYELLEADETVNANFQVGWTDLIALKDGVQPQSCAGLYSLAVSKRSGDLDLAMDFMMYLATDKTTQLMYSEGTYQMPSVKQFYGESEYYAGEDWQAFGGIMENVVTRPGTAIWSQMQTKLSGLMTGWLKNDSGTDTLSSVQKYLAIELKDLEG